MESTSSVDEVYYPEVSKKEVLRYIKDPIHDHIPVNAFLARFIDTKQFQRLRGIKQLGTTSYVWPGASHSRFEHCLGVAYLARLMASHFQSSQPNLGITDRDVFCVEIAGLCHDLGHGPWSHVWDGLFLPVALKDKKWKHEDGSELMFDYLLEENGISLPIKDQRFIKALIAGDQSRTPDEKAFLFDIVANKRNGLDVDKFDYMHRDSHMIGMPINITSSRLVNNARVLDGQICWDIKDANHVYDLCLARFKLHKTVYNHKAAKAIEYMIVDALLLADPILQIAEQVFIPKKFLYLTDDIMPRIESTEHPELAEARAIFDRIRTRDLYKCVDYKVIDWEHIPLFKQITPLRIFEAIIQIVKEKEDSSSVEEDDNTSALSFSDISDLKQTDIIVNFSTMHHGMMEKNPMHFVRFYSKREPNVSRKAGPGDHSNLMPKYFAEDLLRIYTKKQKYFGLVQAGYRRVLAELEKASSEIVVAPEVAFTLTPPTTEAPSTPKAHSRSTSFTHPAIGATSTPFSVNEFTTVDSSFTLGSPSQGKKKVKGTNAKKRKGDSSSVSPSKKRK